MRRDCLVRGDGRHKFWLPIYEMGLASEAVGNAVLVVVCVCKGPQTPIIIDPWDKIGKVNRDLAQADYIFLMTLPH